jgi:hypothetical protein
MYPDYKTTGTPTDEYASCIKPDGAVDTSRPGCMNACIGTPGQQGCPKVALPYVFKAPATIKGIEGSMYVMEFVGPNKATWRVAVKYPTHLEYGQEGTAIIDTANKTAKFTTTPLTPDELFGQSCGPFPYAMYGANLDKCDAMVAANPTKEYRMNMCAATLANPAMSNPSRWCSMYQGNNQATGKLFPEYARCIKADGMVDMSRPRCANVCKGKPGQNGCPGRPPVPK